MWEILLVGLIEADACWALGNLPIEIFEEWALLDCEIKKIFEGRVEDFIKDAVAACEEDVIGGGGEDTAMSSFAPSEDSLIGGCWMNMEATEDGGQEAEPESAGVACALDGLEALEDEFGCLMGC